MYIILPIYVKLLLPLYEFGRADARATRRREGLHPGANRIYNMLLLPLYTTTTFIYEYTATAYICVIWYYYYLYI